MQTIDHEVYPSWVSASAACSTLSCFTVSIKAGPLNEPELYSRSVRYEIHFNSSITFNTPLHVVHLSSARPPADDSAKDSILFWYS